MRRIFEWIGGFALIAFSFYFTDKVSLLVASKSDLMKEIEAVSSIYETKSVDAVINTIDNTIIPGKYGRVVNSQESYLEMHDFGSFNENYLVFDYIKPEKSLEDNKDKFITSGNKEKRRISFIIDNEEVEKYFDSEEIKYDKMLKKYESVKDNAEIINGANNKIDFKEIDSKVKNTAKICLKGESDIELCKKNGYYLVDAKSLSTQNDFMQVKNNIAPGAIILVKTGAKLENVKYILDEVNYKDLEIVKLSMLISEKESS